MAVLHHGYLRATEDIDLLVDASRENIEKVRRALEILPDKAIREMDETSLFPPSRGHDERIRMFGHQAAENARTRVQRRNPRWDRL